MIIKYLSCDGETEIEEEITRAEMFQNMSHNYFLRCARPDGDTFEIYHNNRGWMPPILIGGGKPLVLLSNM